MLNQPLIYFLLPNGHVIPLVMQMQKWLFWISDVINHKPYFKKKEKMYTQLTAVAYKVHSHYTRITLKLSLFFSIYFCNF